MPVTTADVTGATVIYCTPFRGSQIALYDGANWNLRTSAEFSLALGTLASAVKPHDIFCYDNATVPTLEFLIWTSVSARATALVLQDGVLCKTGALTRRYLGTFYPTATTTTEDSGGGTTTQVGGKRFLWNYYNRVRRPFSVFDSTAQYTYTTAGWRQQNAAAGNRVECVIGVAEDAVDFAATDWISSTVGGSPANVGVGIDSTTVPSGGIGSGGSTGANGVFPPVGRYEGFPAAGYHAINCLQYGATTCYFGTLGIVKAVSQGGIYG